MKNKKTRIFIYLFSLIAVIMAGLALFNVLPYMVAMPVSLASYFIVQALKIYSMNKKTSKILFILSGILIIIGIICIFIS